MKYAVILEKGVDAWGAYVPDLPVCAVVADTEEAAIALIREAIDLYIEDLRSKGLAIPEPASRAIEIATS